MTAKTSKARRRAFGIGLVSAMMLLAACGGDSGTAGESEDPTSTPAVASEAAAGQATADTASTSEATVPTVYDGHEADLPTSYPEFETTGDPVTVGFACPACQVPAVLVIAESAQAEIERLGGEMIIQDSGGDPQVQLNQFRQLIAQGAEAIILQPLVETAMAPAFLEAQEAGVEVITIVTPGDTTQPLIDGVASNVTLGFDQAAFNKAQYFASVLPPGSEFALIGFGVPSEGIQYLTERTRYWAEEFGLVYADQVDITELTVTAGQTAGTAILQRHPDVQAVISFSDQAASGVLTAARLLNRPELMVCGQDFDPVGYTNVATENGSCDIRWDMEGVGTLTAQAAYMAITEQNLPLPETVTTSGGILVTPENYLDVDVIGD